MFIIFPMVGREFEDGGIIIFLPVGILSMDEIFPKPERPANDGRLLGVPVSFPENGSAPAEGQGQFQSTVFVCRADISGRGFWFWRGGFWHCFIHLNANLRMRDRSLEYLHDWYLLPCLQRLRGMTGGYFLYCLLKEAECPDYACRCNSSIYSQITLM